ncbi:MAG: YybH family protein [Ferruginibacter sp.]
MKILAFITLVLFSGVNGFAQTPDDVIIRNAMSQQTAAWNAGNIDRFMDTYWQNDSLLFIGKNGPTFGWENTLKNYKKSYPDTAAMGKLSFELIAVKRLSVLYYSVVGKWQLTRSMGNVEGAFTLLFKKIKKKWVIVHDHSS